MGRAKNVVVSSGSDYPAFMAGIAAGVLEALFIQSHDASDVFEGLLSGYAYGDDPSVNDLLNYGGVDS